MSRDNKMLATFFNWKLLFPFFFIMHGCTKILMVSYGIKKVENAVKYKKIKKFILKNNIPDYHFLDSAYNKYNDFSEKSSYFFQPLQVRIYDKKNDSLVGMIVNCKVGGFPNLKWNRYNFFDSLPPPRKITLDSITNLNEDIKFLISLDGSKNINVSNTQKKYVVLVFFNYQMYRQSKRLIKFVRKKYKNFNNFEVYYVLTDLLFYPIDF